MSHHQPVDGVEGALKADAGQPPYLYPDYVSTRLRAPKEPLIILPRTLSDINGACLRARPRRGAGP